MAALSSPTCPQLLLSLCFYLQTWWNCWNNGLGTLSGNTGRRCSTYRSTVNPAIPSADCLDATNRARFNDYNYAFTGHQAQMGESIHADVNAVSSCRLAGHPAPFL